MKVTIIITLVILAILYAAAIPYAITTTSEVMAVTRETNWINVFLKVWLLMPWFIIRNSFNK